MAPKSKQNKENIILDMLLELEKGITYNDCLALNGTKWHKSKRTFDRYWKIAKEQYLEKQEAIKNELAIVSTEAAKERLKSNILSKEQALSILSEIAYSSPKQADRINAVKTMSDIEGWKAPIKTEVSAKVEATNKLLTPEQAKKYLEDLENSV